MPSAAEPRRRLSTGATRGLVAGLLAIAVCAATPALAGAATGAISGDVVASQGHEPTEPVSEVEVVVDNSLGGYVTATETATDGGYTVANLPEGHYKVGFVPTSGNYLTQYYDDQPSLAAATTVAVAAGRTTTEINATLVAGGIIEGTVEGPTGDPLSEATVDVYNTEHDLVAETQTNFAGTYSVSGLPAGGYVVQFLPELGNTDDAAQYSGGGYVFKDAETVSVSEGITSKANAKLALSAYIEGEVTDAATTKQLADVEVHAYDISEPEAYVAPVVTDSSGIYTITGLSPGEYAVEFAAPGNYSVQYYDDKPTLGSATTITLTAGGEAREADAALTAGGRISGTVVNAASERLGEVEVIALNEAGEPVQSALTDEGGTYEVTGLATGGYSVEFLAATGGYAPQYYNGKPTLAEAEKVAVTEDETTTEINAKLISGGSISGTVTAASDHAGLGGVEVLVYDPAEELISSALTDEGGTYEVAGLAPGSYKVQFVSVSGQYSSEYYNNQASFSEAAAVSVGAGAPTSSIDAALAAANGSISGTVTSAAGGAPVAGVAVRIYHSHGAQVTSATTKADGTYAAEGLAPGSYELEFVPPSGAYLTQYYGGAASLDTSTPVTVTAGVSTSPIDAALKAPGAISGTVTNASTRAAVQGVEVEVYDSHGDFVGIADSAANGSYTVSGLSTGSYLVEFVPGSGYVGQYYSDALTPSDASRVAVTAGADSAGINAALHAAGTVSGTVTSAATRQPLSGIEVQVYAEGGQLAGSAHTGAEGTYAVAGLSAGGYLVEFVSPSGTYARQFYEGASVPTTATGVSVTSGATTAGVDAALTAAGAISGTVRSAANQTELDEVQVQVYDAEGEPLATTRTAPDGTYTVGGLAPGSYEVEFAPTTGNYLAEFYGGALTLDQATEVSVGADATTTAINGELLAGAEISGTVYLPGASVGAPEVEVGVYRVTTERSGTERVESERTESERTEIQLVANATTTANGTYTVEGLPSGSYRVGFTPLESEYGQGEYAPQYYKNAATLAHASTVSATAGAETTGINATLARPGAISGTVGEAGVEHSAVASVAVKVFTLEGDYVSSAETANNGTYTVNGLAAGAYVVQFAPPAAYVPQYYREAALLSEATEVTVTDGATTSAINAGLVKAGAISGTVTKASNSAAVQNAEVEVLSVVGERVGSAQTASNGTYTVPGLAPGSYKVRFVATTGNLAPQYYNDQLLLSGATTVSVSAGATHSEVNAALAAGGSITGAVTDAASHAPLAGVQVSVYETERQLVATAETSGAGTYTVSGLAAGSYEAQFVTPSGDHASQFYDEQTTLGQASPIEVTAGSTTGEVDAALVPAQGSLSGQVTAASTHTPIEHVEVKVYDADGTYIGAVETTEGGDYSFGGLAPGDYQVRFIPTAGDYLSQYYHDKPSSGEASPVAVTAGSNTSAVNAELELGGQISGTVTDSGTDARLAHVSVDVYSPTDALLASAETGPNGEYTASGLPPGDYEVGFAGGGSYAPQFYSGAATLAEATSVAVTAASTTPDIDAALTAGGAIAGTVTNALTHLPMPGVEVNVYSAAGNLVAEEQTATDGTYTVSSLPPGSYEVQFVPASEAFVTQYFSAATSLAQATRVMVSASSTTGAVDAAIVPAAAPADIGAPTVAGTRALSATLTCAPGEWSGAPAPTFTYQWLRDGVTLAGATSPTYTVLAADQGHGLACAVTATNRVGHAQAVSAAVQIPAESGGSAAPTPQISLAGAITATANAVLVALRCPAGTVACAPGLIRVTIVEQLRGGRLVALAAKHSAKLTKRTVVVGLQTVTLGAGSTETFKVTLNSAAKKLLLTRKKLAVQVQVSSEGHTLATRVVSVTRAKVKAKNKKKRA